ncbi:hypothetical protein Hanom_Chr02g00139991 [Helianthus anomalus]
MMYTCVGSRGGGGGGGEKALNLMLFYLFRENNVKKRGTVSHASCGSVNSRKTRGTCANRLLSQLLSVTLCPRLDAKLLSSRGSHWKQPLYSYGVEVRLSRSDLLRSYLSFAIGGIY